MTTNNTRPTLEEQVTDWAAAYVEGRKAADAAIVGAITSLYGQMARAYPDGATGADKAYMERLFEVAQYLLKKA